MSSERVDNGQPFQVQVPGGRPFAGNNQPNYEITLPNAMANFAIIPSQFL